MTTQITNFIKENTMMVLVGTLVALILVTAIVSSRSTPAKNKDSALSGVRAFVDKNRVLVGVLVALFIILLSVLIWYFTRPKAPEATWRDSLKSFGSALVSSNVAACVTIAFAVAASVAFCLLFYRWFYPVCPPCAPCAPAVNCSEPEPPKPKE